MTVRVYRSSDASAPSLTGQAGSLITVLDACLVSGYGSQTSSGWTKPFTTATNIAIYRMASGNQRYMRLDDTGAQEGRIHGFETMSSDSDFTTAFTVGVFGVITSAGGVALKKSSSADAVARGWVIVATGSACYVFIEPTSTPTTWSSVNTSSASGNGQFFFGDFISYRPGDVYNTAVIGPTSVASGQGLFGSCSSNITSGANGHVACRSYLGLGVGGVGFAKGVPGLYNNATTLGASSVSNPFPDVITGGLLVSYIEVAEVIGSSHIVRGRLPGIWGSISSLPATHGDVITGTGVVAGKTLLTIGVWNTSTAGRAFVEISDTW